MKKFLILFIWFVTAYDVYCCQYLVNELNPIADWIIQSGDIWTFIALKIFGTAVATELLRVLPPFYTYSIAGLDLALLLFLWSF